MSQKLIIILYLVAAFSFAAILLFQPETNDQLNQLVDSQEKQITESKRLLMELYREGYCKNSNIVETTLFVKYAGVMFPIIHCSKEYILILDDNGNAQTIMSVDGNK